MRPVVMMNKKLLLIIKNSAALVPIFPDGISLEDVLGFRASYLLSAYLLNPIAALRANIMQRIISKNSLRLN
jgi:hypothetical protein